MMERDSLQGPQLSRRADDSRSGIPCAILTQRRKALEEGRGKRG